MSSTEIVEGVEIERVPLKGGTQIAIYGEVPSRVLRAELDRLCAAYGEKNVTVSVSHVGECVLLEGLGHGARAEALHMAIEALGK